MRSSFFEFTVATSALFTARAGLDTTAHNVANASIKGYSRQVVEQRATRPLYLGTGRGMVGTGSEVYGIAQIRSFYLDKKYWNQMSVLGEYSMKNTQLSLTQSIMNEMTGAGLSAQFNTFFDRLQDLTTTAGDNTYRTNLIQYADSIATYFKNTYEAFRKQQRDLNDEVKVTVDTINSLGQQIRSLNEQIAKFELDGSAANDMRDQRARLVDELSRYVNIEVKEVERNPEYAAGKYPAPEDRNKSDKEFIVMLNGYEFVKGVDLNRLEVRERKAVENGSIYGMSYNPEDVDGLYDVYWTNANTKFNLYSPGLTGELKGLIDLRDGNNANYSMNMGYSGYTAATNELVLSMDPADTRVDLNPSGGILSVFDPATGRTTEYRYTKYEYDPQTKEGTFTMLDADDPDIANFGTGGKVITSGQTVAYKGIPYYMSRLNDLARTFAMAFNEGKYMDGTVMKDVIGHVDGYNANGKNLGTLFFTYLDYTTGKEALYDPNPLTSTFNIYNITADNFRVNEELFKHPDLLAAAKAGTGDISDNNVLLSMLKIRTDRSLFLEGTLMDFIIGMTGELGIDVKQAKSFETSYTEVTVTIDNQRMSISGVDVNEEMVAMLKYQQQYQAAAKLINVIDGIYDTLVNRLGNF